MTSIASTAADQSAIQSADLAAAQAIVSSAQQGAISNSSTQFVYFAAFDGTNNDFDGSSSGSLQTTNVQALDAQAKLLTSGTFKEKYFAGPGTPGTLKGSSFAPAQVTSQERITAEAAYKDFSQQAGTWLHDNPSGSIGVALTAFSRGVGTAAIFSQLLYERGLQDPSDPSKVLIPPGQVGISSGVIFDPVTTGTDGNVAFAPNAKNIVSIVAANEYRTPFKGTDYSAQSSQITTIQVLGNHCDIGGGYDNGIAAITLQAATDFLAKSGVPIATPLPSRKYIAGDVYVHEEDTLHGFNWPQYGSFSLTSPVSRQFAVTPSPAVVQTLSGGSTATTLQLETGGSVTVTTSTANSDVIVAISSLTDANGNSVQTTKKYTVANGSPYASTIADEQVNNISVSLPSSVIIVAKELINNDTFKINAGDYVFENLSFNAANADVDLATSAISVNVTNSQTKAVSVLMGVSGKPTSSNRWVASDGTIYQFNAYNSGVPDSGSLSVSAGALGSSNHLTISNFDLSQAETKSNGYLGIKFSEQVALRAGVNADSPFTTAPSSGTAGSLIGEGAAAFTVYASAASDTAQTVSLTLSGGDASDYAISTGANLLNFGGGSVTVTIAAGQDSVTLALVNISDPGASQSLQLTASLQGSDGTPVTSNAIAFDFTEAPVNLAPTHVVLGETVSGSAVTYYDGKNQTADDLIVTGNGPNNIRGYDGNDSIVSGTGDDTIATGNGQSTISGGGHDEILVRNGNNAIYADDQIDLSAAIAFGKSGTATGQPGTLIGTGDGNNTIFGGNGNDLILVGQGNNVIVAGPGTDIIAAGNAVTAEASNWAGNVVGPFSATYPGVSLAPSNYSEPANYEGNSDTYTGAPVGLGNDTIYGGKGNSLILLSNGDNYVDAGGGNSSISGGMGRDTIFGGTGNVSVYGGGGDTYIDGESGNDYLVGEQGNNTIYGGSGNDTIYAGDDVPIAASFGSTWDKSATGNNYVDAGSGNSKIYGSGGNDTLLGGTGNTTIYAGSGNEYIDGGDGDDSINGGSGNDTIFAGDGTDTVFAGSGATAIYGGDGTDYIEGGAGTNLIYAGDGGTADAATSVFAGSGDTTIHGGDGIDYLAGGAGTNLIYAGDGGTADAATSVFAGSGDTTIYGGNGIDQLQGGSGTNVIYTGDGGITDAPTTALAGSGNTTIYGGAGVAVMQGGSGVNTLVAGTGDETLIGGTGINVFVIGPNAGNVVISDTHGKASGDLIDYGSGVAAASLTVTGAITTDGNVALEVDGSSSSVLLVGGLTGSKAQFKFGDTTLNVPTLLQQATAVSDTVVGGNGNLAFNVDAGAQIAAGTGQDTIVSWGSGASVSGGGGSALIAALGSYDFLQAGSGNDTLEAAGSGSTLIGGAGSSTLVADSVDTLIAGMGTTTFVVNNAGTFIQAGAGHTDDIVFSSVSYVVPDNLTQLTLTGTANLTATGNTLNDVITGNAGNDVLKAGDYGRTTLISGSGIDTLIGGYGDDTFVVNNVADVVQAKPYWGGTILSSVNYVLPTGVSNLTLTGSANLTASGSSSGGTLTGNAGNDTLIAGAGGNTTLVAGTGLATLVGGASGATTFVVNNVLDVIQAKAGATNTVQTSFSYAAAANVQNVTGTGSTNLVLTGNNLNNTITANSGNDTLIAGTGASTLVGGAGVDTFVLGSSFNGEVVNTVGGGTLRFGAGVSESGLQFTLASGRDGAPALKISSGSSSILVDDAFTDAIAHYQFADGGNLGLEQLLAGGASGVTSLAGANGSLVLGTGGNASVSGGSGRDTLMGYGNNDTLVAGSGGDLLVAHGTGSVLVGGSGGDTLQGGSGINQFIAGSGGDTLIGGQSGDTYNLTAGGFTTIRANTNSGTETIWLPQGATMEDFTAVRVNDDLVMQSTKYGTTAQLQGYFGAQPAGRTWALVSDTDVPQYLGDWVASHSVPTSTSTAYATAVDAARVTFAANLAANRAGLAGHWLSAQYASPSGYDYDAYGSTPGELGYELPTQASHGPAGLDHFTFAGVSTYTTKIVNGSYSSASPEYDSISTVGTDHTEVTQVPVYGTSYSNQTIVVPWTYNGVVPTGWGYQIVTDSQNKPLYGVFVTGQVHEVQTGTKNVTTTYRSYETSATSGFAIGNVTTDNLDESFYGQTAFGGTIVLGDGNDSVYLPDAAPPVFAVGNQGQERAAPVLGAFIQAGAGNDTLHAGYGQNVFAAGAGFDEISGGGLTQVSDTYGGPYDGSTGEPDTVYAPFSGYATQTIQISNVEFLSPDGGAYFSASNTIVLPSGVTASNLSYRIFDTSSGFWNGYDGGAPDGQALQLNYGNSNALIKLKSTPTATEGQQKPLQVVTGIQNFRFADGTVLSLAQLTSQAHLMANDFAPTVSIHDIALTSGQSVAASSLFSATDAGANKILWYDFQLSAVAYGEGDVANTNFFMVNGVERDYSVRVSAADLDKVSYVAGASGSIESLSVKVFDGATWSSASTAQLSVLDAAPTDVLTAVSYTAGPTIRTITGTGSADITLVGNALANTIAANAGNDTLIAGAGPATLIGGSGNDTFVINNLLDVVQAQAGGVNTVLSSVDYAAGANVSSVTGVGTGALTLTGNSLANTITANSGDDTLVAGSGIATLVGGAGNDTFIVNNAEDVIQFSQGTQPSQLSVITGALDASGNAILEIEGMGGSVSVVGGLATAMPGFQFAGGAVLSEAAFLQEVSTVSGVAASIGDRVWIDANGNGIQDTGETGEANVTVNLMLASTGALVSSTTTDINGVYHFSGLAAGQYQMQFVAPTGDTFSPDHIGSDATLDSNPGSSGYTGAITLTAGQADNTIDAGLIVPSAGTASIGDRVWIDANGNGIQDTGETGAANVAVNLGVAGVNAVLASTTTDANGAYHFTGLAAGQYQMQFVAPTGDTFSPDHVGSDATLDSNPGSSGYTGAITLTAGQADNTIDAGLIVPSAGTASIGDRVWIDANGNGIQDTGETGAANVAVNLGVAGVNAVLASTTTDANGAYHFTGLAAGQYQMQFVAPTGDTFSPDHIGSDATLDSNPGSSGYTGAITLTAGQADNTIDAGLIVPSGTTGNAVHMTLVTPTRASALSIRASATTDAASSAPPAFVTMDVLKSYALANSASASSDIGPANDVRRAWDAMHSAFDQAMLSSGGLVGIDTSPSFGDTAFATHLTTGIVGVPSLMHKPIGRSANAGVTA